MPVIKILVIAVSLLAAMAVTSVTWAAEWLALDRVQLIDGAGAAPRALSRLLIKDGRIVALSATVDQAQAAMPELQAFDRFTQIDLNGAWLMPGLIDTHVHVARFPNAQEEARRILAEAVRGGVTSVRDLGGDARALAEVQRALRNHERVGPSVVFSAIYGGPSLFKDQRISGFAGGYPHGQSPWTQAVDAATELPLVIAASKGSGASGIKIYGNLAAEQTDAIIQAAHQQGLRTWAHATVFPSGPQDLVNAGIDSLSHAAYLIWAAMDEIPDDYSARTQGPWTEIAADHPRLIQLYQSMAKQRVTLDATLYVYEQMKNFSPQVDASWTAPAAAWGAQAVATAHQHGVLITTGTDWFEPRPGELPHTHEEMALLVEKAGLTPMQAIVAATRNGAIASGIDEERGTVEIGKAADLLVLTQNPLEDIHNTTSLRMVIKDGKVIEPLFCCGE